jgi:hypothetical protein
MVQSVTPVSAMASSGDGDAPEQVRRAVLAGPGAGVDVGEHARGGLLTLLGDPQLVWSRLAGCGHVDRRKRVLTGAVTVLVTLGLCLLRREGYELVLARMAAAVPGMFLDGPPTGQALSQARVRLGEAPMRQLFTATAAAALPDTPGASAFGLALTAFDGTVIDLPPSKENLAAFTVPAGGTYPQVRLVTLTACGSRWQLAAAMDSIEVSEQALVDQLETALGAGMLNLADRNFFSLHRWVRFAATGAQLAWRVKNGARSLPGKLIEVLPDGSSLVRLRESDSMLSRRRARAGDPRLRRLPRVIARLVEFVVTTTDTAGRARPSRLRVLTTLLDHHQYPAGQIATVYAERWAAEVAYYQLKVTLRGAGTRLRAHTPQVARQEIWALLTVYNMLVDLAVRTAVGLGVDCDKISFTAVLAHTRAMLAAAVPCPGCGHRPQPGDPLLAAIAVHPPNRTGRHRQSPRTKAERRTQRTREVSYTIEIVTSNLPKVDECPQL